MFTLSFKTENDAFAEDARAEIVRLLCHAGAAIARGDDAGKLIDSNGNTVGTFNYDAPEGDDEGHQSYCAAVRHAGEDCDCEGFGEYEKAEA